MEDELNLRIQIVKILSALKKFKHLTSVFLVKPNTLACAGALPLLQGNNEVWQMLSNNPHPPHKGKGKRKRLMGWKIKTTFLMNNPSDKINNAQ